MGQKLTLALLSIVYYQSNEEKVLAIRLFFREDLLINYQILLYNRFY